MAQLMMYSRFYTRAFEATRTPIGCQPTLVASGYARNPLIKPFTFT